VLRRRIAEVRKGWREDEVLKQVGQPTSRVEQKLYYLSDYYATSLYTQYEIRFADGVVVEIEAYGGCDHLEPDA